ncbi:hypothetical protein PISMIDRAFT_684992 [Pisolithus microcarpus 441]|uniref:Uncharacterized protein n=1 Tax=Pisolithus microcarpus 441 TaxID=765257 RepID=A0A0C9ZCQ8_9AGAM|nr:hypothetical protein PISMIDRAFT_684992 [Pisolithus microcarpus 441]
MEARLRVPTRPGYGLLRESTATGAENKGRSNMTTPYSRGRKTNFEVRLSSRLQASYYKIVVKPRVFPPPDSLRCCTVRGQWY